ncbi:MAG: hypothetical protein WA183_00160 [Chthoniobacterales bacterium]
MFVESFGKMMFIPNQKPGSYALNVHFNGLSHLYSFVKGEEERRLKEYPRVILALDVGSSDRGDIILNHFIWYSNSFVPFIDLFSRKNLRREFRAVKKWRDKVAAHFSMVNPGRRRPVTCPVCGALIKPERKGDSEVVRTASVNQFVTWSNGRFSVGREVISKADTGDSTPGYWGWELTEVHERVLSILKGYT